MVAFVVVVLSAVIGLPPRIDPDLLALLPEEDPAVQALVALHHDSGGVNLVTLAFEADDPEALEPALARLVSDLEASPRIRFALHELDPTLAKRLGVLQLDRSDVGELASRMRGALALGPALNPLVSSRLMAMGPVSERIAAATDPKQLPGLAAGSGRVLLKPTGSSHDRDFAIALMAELDEHIAAMLVDNPGVRSSWVGGAYRHNVEDYKGIAQDLWWTTGASIALVLAVLVIAFRGARAPVIVLVPLVVANIVNLALVHVFLGSINTFTSFGTAILVGLGIDFAVHLVGRYRELRASGQELHPAIVQAWDRTGPPCTTAALTSAAGFIALAAARFQGFSQLGLLLAMGLLVCLVAMLVLLPVLLSTLDREAPPLVGTALGSFPGRSTYAVAPVGLMVAVLATGFVGATRLPEVAWEFDFSALRRDGLAYAELSTEERALALESYSPVVVSFATAEEGMRVESRIERALAARPDGHVERVVSVSTLLPLDQDARLVALRTLQEHLSHPNLRYLPPPLVTALQPLASVPLEALVPADLPVAMQELLGVDNGEAHRLLLFPRGNMWDLRQAADLQDEVTELVGDQRAAGEYVALGSLYRTIVADLPVVAGLAFVLVALLTAIDLRRPHWVVGALGTLMAGMVWAGAALQAAGIHLNVINVMGIPILLGIGVDMVIHLLHRLREEGPGGVRRALRTTGVAAMISTLTTVLSFSSLILAGNRGVRSMGLLVVLGLLTVFVVTACVLPTAWAAGWKVTGRAPADAPLGPGAS